MHDLQYAFADNIVVEQEANIVVERKMFLLRSTYSVKAL